MVASYNNCNSNRTYYIGGENIWIFFWKMFIILLSGSYMLINASYYSYRMKITDGYLPFTINLSLRMVWQVRVEVKEQFRIWKECLLCFSLLLLWWRRWNVKIFSWMGVGVSTKGPAAGNGLDICHHWVMVQLLWRKGVRMTLT